MEWHTFDKEVPKTNGMYMISIHEDAFKFKDTGGSVIDCPEQNYTRQAELWTDRDGVHHWDFLNEDATLTFHFDGETHTVKTGCNLTEDTITITAWAEMPKPFEKQHGSKKGERHEN